MAEANGESTAALVEEKATPPSVEEQSSVKKEPTSPSMEEQSSMKKEPTSPSLKKESTFPSVERESTAPSVKKEVEVPSVKKEVEVPTALEKKIIKQVEYYFGDINLARDKFLQEEAKKEEGWVSMETMLKFKRLAEISNDTKIITEALKKSSSKLMEVNEDGSKIRRSPSKPLPENTKDRRDDIKLRSVYAKGFPLESTLDELQEFFDKSGKTEQVQLRKDQLKSFKGSCFVVYADKASAKKFLEDDESKKYGDVELIKYFKDDYFKKKEDEKREKKEAENKTKEEKKKQREDKDDEQFKERITKGAILELKNIPDEVTREDLKEMFDSHAKIAWAEFDKGDKEAKLRFEEEGSAQIALDAVKAANDGKVLIKETELECKVLEGEDELEHWRGLFSELKDRRERRRFPSRKRRGGGWGGGRGGGPPHKRKRGGD